MSASATSASGENLPWYAETRRLLIEWLSLPRERPAELLGGRIVEKRSATLVHGAAQGGVTPPDWVCEILSTSTASHDLGRKWRAYQRAGVSWYWLVSVPHQSLTVYRRTELSYELCETATPGDPVSLPPFESIAFHLAPLFLPEP